MIASWEHNGDTTSFYKVHVSDTSMSLAASTSIGDWDKGVARYPALSPDKKTWYGAKHSTTWGGNVLAILDVDSMKVTTRTAATNSSWELRFTQGMATDFANGYMYVASNTLQGNNYFVSQVRISDGVSVSGVNTVVSAEDAGDYLMFPHPTKGIAIGVPPRENPPSLVTWQFGSSQPNQPAHVTNTRWLNHIVEPRAVTVDSHGTYAYIGGGTDVRLGDGTLARFMKMKITDDPLHPLQPVSSTVPDWTSGGMISDIVMDPSGNNSYALLLFDSDLLKVDTHTLSHMASLSLPDNVDITCVFATATAVYVGTNASPGQVHKLNVDTLSTEKTLSMGVGFDSIVTLIADVDSGFLYAASQGSLFQISIQSFSLTGKSLDLEPKQPVSCNRNRPITSATMYVDQNLDLMGLVWACNLHEVNLRTFEYVQGTPPDRSDDVTDCMHIVADPVTHTAYSTNCAYQQPIVARIDLYQFVIDRVFTIDALDSTEEIGNVALVPQQGFMLATMKAEDLFERNRILAVSMSGCMDGFYHDVADNSCRLCPSNTYTTRVGLSKCTSCPLGMQLKGSGHSDARSCVLCTEGTYTPSPGESCTLCPSGSYCPAGSSVPIPRAAITTNGLTGSAQTNPQPASSGGSGGGADDHVQEYLMLAGVLVSIVWALTMWSVRRWRPQAWRKICVPFLVKSDWLFSAAHYTAEGRPVVKRKQVIGGVFTWIFVNLAIVVTVGLFVEQLTQNGLVVHVTGTVRDQATVVDMGPRIVVTPFYSGGDVGTSPACDPKQVTVTVTPQSLAHGQPNLRCLTPAQMAREYPQHPSAVGGIEWSCPGCAIQQSFAQVSVSLLDQTVTTSSGTTRSMTHASGIVWSVLLNSAVDGEFAHATGNAIASSEQVLTGTQFVSTNIGLVSYENKLTSKSRVGYRIESTSVRTSTTKAADWLQKSSQLGVLQITFGLDLGTNEQFFVVQEKQSLGSFAAFLINTIFGLLGFSRAMMVLVEWYTHRNRAKSGRKDSDNEEDSKHDALLDGTMQQYGSHDDYDRSEAALPPTRQELIELRQMISQLQQKVS
eukprot:TRINITY_DN66546_c6_g1_i1.p1 TRINITY_DN66546_c6_g1~~TRINITY_DN66546_c6_g1_i1.p1  ORF type:complete len:1058 (+),score=434.01 TRINITY_DN66546_c6_g1_i1:422-3595(+)